MGVGSYVGEVLITESILAAGTIIHFKSGRRIERRSFKVPSNPKVPNYICIRAKGALMVKIKILLWFNTSASQRLMHSVFGPYPVTLFCRFWRPREGSGWR